MLVDYDGEHKRFNATQVKSYIETETVAIHHMAKLIDTFTKAGLAQAIHATFMTEVIKSSDPRATSPEMEEAIASEIRDLTDRNAFSIIRLSDLPPKANLLPARFVLVIKTSAEGATRYKARYVIGGHRDRLKLYIVHDSQTVHASSVRIVVCLAAIFGFEIWSSDVKLAYLQSSEPMTRRVFIKNPAPQFGLEEDQCLELLKPLYGLSDSGDSWHATLDKHLVRDLGMKASKIDRSLSFKHDDRGRLIGINASYVDDLLRAGTPDFRKICKITNERFETSPDEELPLTFAGIQLSKSPEKTICIDQSFYLRKLEELEKDATFPSFRSMRMKLAWLANSRPDICFAISQIAQVTEKVFNEDKHKAIKLLNSTIRYTVSHPTTLKFRRLDLRSLRLIGYSDAAFANNADLSSQLGRIVFLSDKHDNASPIVFKSYKSHRVTRSILAAEVIAFSDLFDDAYAIRTQLQQALNRDVPLHLFTDSKSLFDIISKGSRTREKRVMLDVYAAREGYTSQCISNIGFVRSEYNIADGLTKPKVQAALFNVVNSGKHRPEVEQWIMRVPPPSSEEYNDK